MGTGADCPIAKWGKICSFSMSKVAFFMLVCMTNALGQKPIILLRDTLCTIA